MNNLDVTKFGVQELNAKEMVEVEGGQRTTAGKWLKAVGEFTTWFAETFM